MTGCEGRGWLIEPGHTQWCGPSGCASECPEAVQVRCPGCFDCLDPRGPEGEPLTDEDLCNGEPW